MSYLPVGVVYTRDHRTDQTEEERQRARQKSQERYEKRMDELGIEPGCQYDPGTVIRDYRKGKGYVADDSGCPVEDPDLTAEIREELETGEDPVSRASKSDGEGALPGGPGGGGLPGLPGLGPSSGIPDWLIWGGAVAGAGLLALIIVRRR